MLWGDGPPSCDDLGPFVSGSSFFGYRLVCVCVSGSSFGSRLVCVSDSSFGSRLVCVSDSSFGSRLVCVSGSSGFPSFAGMRL